jgi:hypothetical protein
VDSFIDGAAILLAKQELLLLPVNGYELNGFLKKCFQDLDLDCVIENSILKNYSLVKVGKHSESSDDPRLGKELVEPRQKDPLDTNEFSKCLFGSEIKLTIKLESPMDLFISPQDLSKY